MAMMGNWETVLQYQEDYNNGFTIGSAQREQERYLDSIEGKWNTLKENLKNLVTTTISSDFAKGFLDGAISFTDGLNSAFKVLDEFNAVLPATIGLITSLGQSFRVLSGNGSIELFGSGIVNGIKSFNEALKGTTINYSTTNSGIQKLANNQTKLSKSTIKTSDAFKQYSLRVGDTSQSIVRINRENTTLAKSQTKVAGGMKNVISSFTQSAAGSKLAMVGTSLLNGALIGLASWGIGQAITAFDNYINRHKIAAEEARESIDVINGEIQGYQSQKKSLESISKEYDSLAKKTNKTASEMERFSELKNEIANIMPELVLGYDENNDPILAMNGNVQDLIKELDRAVESKQRLLESKENDLGINATENIKKAVKELESSYTSMNLALQGGRISANNALSDKNWWGGEVSIKERTQKVIKALEDEEKAYNERYNEHLANLEEYYAREQEIQKKNLNEIFKKDSYKALQDDLKGSVNSFAALFDWGEYDLSGQKQMVRGIEDLTKAVAEGKIDLEDFNTRWQSINDTFQNTGDIDQYNKSINELAKELEKATGVEAGKWVEGLNQQFEGLSYADAKLNKFLQSYNSSLDQLRNGDSLAINLKKQFEELARFSDLIDSEFIATGKIDVELLAEVKESESFKYLPQQIQTAIDGIISDNKVTEAEQDILLRLKTIIQNEGALDDDVSEQLNRLFQGKSTQQELEIGIKIGDYHIPPELMKILNSEYEGKNTEINFKINTENIEKLDEITKKHDELDGKTTESTHKTKTEGKEELEKSKETQDKVDGKTTESTHKINSDGAEEVKEDINEITEKKKELEKPTNLSINKGELQGSVDEFNKLIEYSTKLKDGEYQISFKSDTADAIAQIENLKLAVNNLSNQFMQIPSTTVTLNTSLAAKNLSGLIVRINQTKEALGSLSSKNVNVNTAQSAKNLSGLITRVNQYKAAISSVATKTCSVETAQGAKNLSGLISKIDSYNKKTISTKTVKVNVSNAISQINTLLNKINSLPRTKTVTVKVSQSGSVPKIASRSMPYDMAEPVAMASEISQVSDTPENAPQARNYSRPIDVINKGYNYFIELENQLKKINNQISILDTKMENAFGPQKINYLNQQINLYKEQQKVQQSLINDMTKYQSSLKSYLSGKGFKFDSIGNITNYHTKLIAMEKELERLETIANKDKATDKQKKAYENYRNNLEEIKKVMSEYIDITFTDLPNAQEEWYELSNSITNTTKEIEEIKKKHKELINEAKVYTLTDAYKDLEHELSKIDKLLKNSNGQNKINLLNKQLDILKQQQAELKKQESLLISQRDVLKNDLSKLGFTFDSTGDLTNYAAQLDKLFNQGKDIDEITDILDKYFDLQNDKIPGIIEDWMDLSNSIQDTKDEIEEIRVEHKKLVNEAKIYTLTDAYKDLEHELSKIEKLLEYSSGNDKLNLLNKQLDILKQQQNELEKQHDLLSSQKKVLKNELVGYGFTFDSSGDITNYASQLDNLFNQGKNIEKIKDILDEYFELQNEELPGIIEGWLDLDNTIKDVLKDQLETTSEVEKKITEIYKKQVEDRIAQIEKEADAKVKALKKQQDEYNKYREDVKYDDEYDEKLESINELQRQLDIAMKDTSLNGQKRVKELQKQLAEAQKELEKFTQDRIDNNINDMFDKEAERIEEESNKTIENLENQWSDSKIAEMVAQALGSGVFTDIEGNVSSLEDALINFAEETGELFGVLGATIKDELITNLQVAQETVRDLHNILAEFDLSSISGLSSISITPSNSLSRFSTQQPSQINFSAPLINVEGNVDSNVVDNLKEFGEQLKDDIINTIATAIR